MTDNATFEYIAILDSGLSRVTSLAAYTQSLDEPLRGVLWSARERKWVYRPSSIAFFHFDPEQEDRTQMVDRTEAERIAREDLGTAVPSEDELRQIVATAASEESR
ncbi:hypothetical protein [Actinoplanes sp. NPDC089786]|uniref:hypothetical protein n=1 Tax=Actinoplanes sp. NPDC089786 TaxID=3155185 RepID=UPI00342A9F45